MKIPRVKVSETKFIFSSDLYISYKYMKSYRKTREHSISFFAHKLIKSEKSLVN